MPSCPSTGSSPSFELPELGSGGAAAWFLVRLAMAVTYVDQVMAYLALMAATDFKSTVSASTRPTTFGSSNSSKTISASPASATNGPSVTSASGSTTVFASSK